MLSHTEAYGEALPDEGNFDTGKWADFVDWQKEHSGQRNARGDVNGWHVEYHVEGPTAKFIVTKRD
ncbi:hypothetical protein [Micrococcoides hystricis]|uniref:Uncharacterized protein n=1 Tax=Micrococcoides hystricis TaxID=1572761 RepID=A0ABV6P8K6_9MICC